MSYGFYAMLNRMKLINRWSLMRNTSSENLQEHSLQVAILAHALALIRQEKFSEGRLCPPAEQVMAVAVFHDAGEIITGDMPTPIKYYSPELRRAYQAAENEANDRLLAMLPDDMSMHYAMFFREAESPMDEAIHELVRAADKLAAYIKCIEELSQGNNEFKAAKEQCENKVKKLDLPEVDFFLEHFLPSFELSLDELQQS